MTAYANHVQQLVDGLDTERRLVEELDRVMISQRDGVARDDLGKIDDSMYAAQRILGTLKEARRLRGTLLRALGCQEETPLADLHLVIGSRASDELIASRDALVASA